MKRAAAINEIDKIFFKYKALLPKDKQLLKALKDGKLFELYVLSHVVKNLDNRGFHVAFKGQTLKFKASPGKIKSSDPHFEIGCPNLLHTNLGLFVDIEFETLGSQQVNALDNSRRHELDIVVTTMQAGYPAYAQVALGVECKAVANFSKSILKEVLGVRRELSLLAEYQPSDLTKLGGSPPVEVPAKPASEYWLAYIDPKGDAYKESPGAFGVEFKLFKP